MIAASSPARAKKNHPKVVFPELLGVAFAELVDAAAGIDQLLLAGIERMRGRRNFNFQQRVFLAVFPFDGFLGRSCGTGDECMPVTHVLEND